MNTRVGLLLLVAAGLAAAVLDFGSSHGENDYTGVREGDGECDA